METLRSHAPRLLALVSIAAACALAPTASAQSPLPAPKLGAAPDLAPVEGQDPTPRVLRDCKEKGGMPNAQVAGVDPRGADPRSPNPINGLRFFVDPTEPAFLTYSRFMRSGREKESRLM